jgi:hypothetical protein
VLNITIQATAAKADLIKNVELLPMGSYPQGNIPLPNKALQ